MMIDIDRFKAYNDRYGHLAGDDCLRMVAEALGGCRRRPHDLLARYGGEEFVILLPGADAHALQRIGDEVLGAVQSLHITHEGSAHTQVTISAGWASTVPKPGGLPEGLIASADRCLYLAKQNGRNRVEGLPVRPVMAARERRSDEQTGMFGLPS